MAKGQILGTGPGGFLGGPLGLCGNSFTLLEL
jgi:hypothetical protein